MEITKEHLERMLKGFQDAAQQHRTDAIANSGAADAIELVLKDLSIEEVKEAQDGGK